LLRGWDPRHKFPDTVPIEGPGNCHQPGRRKEFIRRKREGEEWGKGLEEKKIRDPLTC
jgi:hypothetical protein